MKNIKNSILALLVVTAGITAKAQNGLPLHQGSIVITHSPGNGCLSAPDLSDSSNSAYVISILDASNTSNIPENALESNSAVKNRFSWTPNNTANPKNPWIHSEGSNVWSVRNLGRVFGVTLDETGNIYVSNTSIYQGEGNPSSTNHDKIWKIDGTSGAMTAIWSSAVNINSTKGLGNLKCFTQSGTKFIVFSNWEDGLIYFIRENASTGAWTNAGTFDPMFGEANDNTNVLPYGVGIRNNGTDLELYYGELNINLTKRYNGQPFNQVMSNRLFKTNLSFASGTVSANTTETMVLASTTNAIRWINGGFPTHFAPISDISFSSNNDKMIIAYQSLEETHKISAHNSEVKEYAIVTSPPSCTLMKRFPAGFYKNTTPTLATVDKDANGFASGMNAVGGVTYWNNVLYTNAQTACNASVLYTSDIIYLGNHNSNDYCTQVPPTDETSSQNYNPANNSCPTVYGIMGLPSNYQTTGAYPGLDAFNYSLKIDADDYYSNCDKFNLGDIEAYNTAISCTPPCNCGTWERIEKGNNTNYWVNSNPQTRPQTISWEKGNIPSDIILPRYNCTNDCQATFSYALSSRDRQPILLNANEREGLSLTANSKIINNLPCGEYLLTIMPKCGSNNCPPIRIPIVISCPPPCNTCSGEARVNVLGDPTVTAGKVALNYTLSNSIPVTEVRASVEEFRVVNVTGNESCMLCQNKPKTWGSIQSASLTGTNSTSALSSAITVDNREAIFKNPPLFNLANNTLSLSLALPDTTGLSCCTLKAEICIKFIIRDINCCEKEIVKCFSVNLK